MNSKTVLKKYSPGMVKYWDHVGTMSCPNSGPGWANLLYICFFSVGDRETFRTVDLQLEYLKLGPC